MSDTPSPDQPRPDRQPDYDELDREALDFLLAQREEAIAAGVGFIGAITGGDGPLLLVAAPEPGLLDLLEDTDDDTH